MKEINNDEIHIKIEDRDDIYELFGNMDANINLIKEHFDIDVYQRNNELIIKGRDAKDVEKTIKEMLSIIKSGESLDMQKLDYLINLEKKGKSFDFEKVSKEVVCVTYRGKPVKPKTLGQKKYAACMKENDIVFGIGPAGTGKTYLAIAMAVNAFKNKEINRIVLSRPAVEAGEKLGFLPGDLQEKVDPYLRPLYDALYDILGSETVAKYREKELIEIVPLAYMRGRTLDNSFVILDEAQNTTKEQMKMFLTRLGVGSKAIITGDITQIDLPRGKDSGLKEAVRILDGIKGIEFSFLKDTDVVRHKLVQLIIKAYEEHADDYINENNKK